MLSQWRSYGSEGERFSLRFNVPWLVDLEKDRFRLQRVIYERAQQIDLILMFLTMANSLLAKHNLTEEG